MRLALVGLDSIYWPDAFADAVAGLAATAGQPAAAGHSLVATCDLGRTPAEVEGQLGVRAVQFADRRGLRLVHTVEEAAAAADACLVCTRNTVMPEVIEFLCTRGRPVFAAKPVAASIDGMSRALAAQRAGGRACAAGMSARSSAALRTAVRLVAGGAVGDVLSVRVAHQHGRFADWPDRWWYADPAEGGPFLWLGWYVMDGVVALTGSRVRRVAGAARQHRARHGEMPDLLRGIAELEDGRTATLEVHFTVGEWGLASFEIEVVGTRGVLRTAGPRQEAVILADGGPRVVPLDTVEDPLGWEISSWLRSIEGSGRPVVSFEDAAHLVAASVAWERAAREGRWVDVEPVG